MNLLNVFKKMIKKGAASKTAHYAESGSVMLEVVAVLALMGVMGAMLFRQIYQRNQELHNIQMASEIRTVKEAFAAYIQSDRASILSTCKATSCASGSVCRCKTWSNYTDVANYLPDGWFADEDDLERAYTLTMWYYSLDDGTGDYMIYGIVTPTSGTLPTTGWNFRRAARVALLIGADGGAYNNDITSGHINGTMGSWEIELDDNAVKGTACDNQGADCSFYVATTGIDIFTPEYQLPDGSVNLKDPWSLALQDLHAYNYFSVGNAAGSPHEKDCYGLGHTLYNPANKVDDDTINPISANCKPLFWVGARAGGPDADTGNVYVATDLKIGDIEGTNHNEALTLTKEGVIRQKDGLTIDKDGRIISREKVSASIGDLKEDEHFVLDPAYTSTMNDIRLTSRGGARLSDILPNYILKEVGTKNTEIGGVNINDNGNWEISAPTCPSGYTRALIITPFTWNQSLTGNTANHGIDVAGEMVDLTDLSISGGLYVAIKTANESGIWNSSSNTAFGALSGSSGGAWYVRIRNQNENSNMPPMQAGQNIMVHYQTYCVWTPSLYTTQQTCEGAGYTWTAGAAAGSRCGGTKTSQKYFADRYKSSDDCVKAGGTWDGTRGCKITLPANAAAVEGLTAVTGETADEFLARKARLCKMIGAKWNGANCS